ncbi:MAG: hypothetical protein M4579_004440 [Chaenotheca gracillima]|nr:MAG: hypothetical protein M4579_004440 [Chaenotheca gracillima]
MSLVQDDCAEINASVLHGAKDMRLVSYAPMSDSYIISKELIGDQERRRLELPGSEELQVSVRSTGLCGSDLHYYNHYRNGDILVREPMSLGHESSGVVSAVGSAVKGFKVGDRVALEVGLPCQVCHQCTQGRYNICKELRFRSSAKSFPHFQGTLQDKINHPAAWCHRLPDNVSLDLGALLEPLSVALHGSRRAEISSGHVCLVLGAGAVGLLCAAMCIARGASTVIIADIQEERVNFATQNGFAHEGFVMPRKACDSTEEKLNFAREVATLLLNSREVSPKNAREVDVTFECTGVESCLQTAIYTTRPGGKIMLIGMGAPVQTLPISAAALREVDLVGVFRYADTYQEAIELVSKTDGPLPDLKKLITHRFRGLENASKAFDRAMQPIDADGALVLKVLIDTETA